MESSRRVTGLARSQSSGTHRALPASLQRVMTSRHTPGVVLGASRSLLLSHSSGAMTASYKNEAGEAWKGCHLPEVAAGEWHNWDLNWNLPQHPQGVDTATCFWYQRALRLAKCLLDPSPSSLAGTCALRSPGCLQGLQLLVVSSCSCGPGSKFRVRHRSSTVIQHLCRILSISPSRKAGPGLHHR